MGYRRSISDTILSSATTTEFRWKRSSALRIDGRRAGNFPASRISALVFPSLCTATATTRCWAPSRTASTTLGSTSPTTPAAPLNLNHNPRNQQPYFNIAEFSENALGTPGNVPRRFFSGPGLENFDMALLKNVRLNESKSLQFRVEAFNVFNHTQFFGAQSVDGNIASSTFGQVINADPPRLVQLGAKFFF